MLSLRPVKRFARKLGLTDALVKIRYLGLPQTLAEAWARRRYLPTIGAAPALPAGAGDLEGHMLLHHAALYEGLWAFYSFIRAVGRPCRLIIHDDGSLSAADQQVVQRVLPGCRIVPRALADSTVAAYLRGHGWERCARLRRELVFGLKLFDPFLFGENPSFILIDSDVLFYRRPDELIAAAGEVGDRPARPRYSPDNGYRYCLSPDELSRLLGRECIARFNPGVLCVRRDAATFGQLEAYLAHPRFWNADGSANYYAELTLWAMQLTLLDAEPLPETYAICPTPQEQPGLIYGHYCGGLESRAVYYIRALPYVAAQLQV